MFKILSILAIFALAGCAVYPVQPYSTVVQQPVVVEPAPIYSHPVVVSPPIYRPPVVVNPVPIYRPPVVYSRPAYPYYTRPCCGGIYYRGPNVSVGVRF